MEYQLISATGATFIALFPIANPIGVVPIFYSMTVGENAKLRSIQARRVAINAAIILVVFFVGGKFILDFFGISLGVLQMAGGLLVGRTAWQMATSASISTESQLDTQSLTQEDIALIPIAIPIVSGPGAIGMAIALAAQSATPWAYFGSILGIGLLGLTVYLCLSLGEPVVKILGKRGLKVLNQILGFFILAIAIQLMADGTFALIREFIG